MPDNKKRVFISYAREDKAFASELGNLMKERGVSVFLDTDLTSGSFWSDVLRREIERATALVLVIPSHNVANRNNIWFEAGAAKALGKPVLAVLPPKHDAGAVDLHRNRRPGGQCHRPPGAAGYRDDTSCPTNHAPP